MAAARAPYVLISMADGSDEPEVVDRWLLARDGADVVAASDTCAAAIRSVGRGSSADEPSCRAEPSLVRRGADPRSDQQLQALQPPLPRLGDDRETAGFELALELSVKATLAGRRLAEVPTTWRDRTAGKARKLPTLAGPFCMFRTHGTHQ